MIVKPINSQNKKFCLYITIKCSGEKSFHCVASDFGGPSLNKQQRDTVIATSKYADRPIKVNGQRTIYFSFPVTPKAMILTVYNFQNKEDKDFEVILEEKPLKEYAVWLDEDTRQFLGLALNFSQRCGFDYAAPNGRTFQTADDKFKIKYFPVIKDYMSGQVLSTPARVGHRTGIIEVSKRKMVSYTIPMRMIILLHEFSHKYRNPKMDLPISNETGADVNALYIYLGLGFSKVDAIYVFANVFLKAQTKGNIERMRTIMDYIQRFENQEFARIS
jgi:hypothetical protein